MQFPWTNVEIVRRGVTITLPNRIYKKLEKESLHITVLFSNVSGNPTCVQLFNKDSKYCGTLKNYMGIKGFKNKNVCDFRKSNLIFK